MVETMSAFRKQEALVQSLQTTVYGQFDTPIDLNMVGLMAHEQKKLRHMKLELVSVPNDNPGKPRTSACLLGEETTELSVETKVMMQPLPTSIYNLLEPLTHPLLEIRLTNHASQARRIRITSFIEGLSAQAVKTIELPECGSHVSISMRPTLLPERVRMLTEIQWATLHVIVEILGNTNSKEKADLQSFSIVCERHDTYSILCLARTSSFNYIIDPNTGLEIDFSQFYGAWVTPYDDSVQELVRRAASLSPQMGYQRDPHSVSLQVKALFQTLHLAELKYINSVIDYGAAFNQHTQRTRLPRESLKIKSANCIDGTVLMCSLLEGASLNPAIILVPRHAFLGWETWPDSNEWNYLETVMIGSGDFEAACSAAAVVLETQRSIDPEAIIHHSLADLRRKGIFPME